MCTDLDVCAPYVGSYSLLSDELWRFSTSTLGWERIHNTVVNGAVPSGRMDHVMTSVGLDLWVHGGVINSGEGDVYTICEALLLLMLW